MITVECSRRDIAKSRIVACLAKLDEARRLIEEAGKDLCPVLGFGLQHCSITVASKHIRDTRIEVLTRLGELQAHVQRDPHANVLTLDRNVSEQWDAPYMPQYLEGLS